MEPGLATLAGWGAASARELILLALLTVAAGACEALHWINRHCITLNVWALAVLGASRATLLVTAALACT
jgi:hypothetical protein